MLTTKKKISLIVLLILALLFIFGKNHISEIANEISNDLNKVPSIKRHLINISKVAIPLKNLVLMRNVDDKIALLKSSRSCAFCNLTQGNFKGNDLNDVDLRYAALIGANLSNANLSGAKLRHANLSGANLTGVKLRDIDSTARSQTDLTGANLSGVDLSNNDLTGTFLLHAKLTGANLDGVDLSNKDLTGTLLKVANKIEINLKNSSNSNWPTLNEMNVISYDLSGDVHYLATMEGLLFESKNNESRLVLDLNNDAQFPFYFDASGSAGLLSVASQNKLVYVAYSSKDINGLVYLVVDEYSMNFSKVRNIIKIELGSSGAHTAGALSFDSLGKLYLSVGDTHDTSQPQNLNSLKGKILRLDVSKSKLKPEIIVFGIRNAWGVTIDSKDRMFIMQCGLWNSEAVYLLNDLYSGIPANIGWPVFEGSIRMLEDPLMFNDVLAPIFEYNNRPACATAGVYLNDIESFLLGDYFGTIRLLKQQENGAWYLAHEYKQEKFIWNFGFDKKTKKIFVAPHNSELEILVDQVNFNQ